MNKREGRGEEKIKGKRLKEETYIEVVTMQVKWMLLLGRPARQQ